MVEVAWHLEPTLFAVGAVSYTETLLHPWLPCPRVDGVFAPHMAFATRRRGCRLCFPMVGLHIHSIRMVHGV